MIQIFGQMMKIPLTAFVYGMEMLAKTMQGIQEIAYQGIDMMANEVTQTLDEASGSKRGLADAVTTLTQGASTGDSTQNTHQSTHEEKKKMRNTDLMNDNVKLVQYTIVSVVRGNEGILTQGEQIVADAITDDGFISYVVAEYVQKYNITPLEAQNLRVYFSVLDSWPKASLHYEEKQLEILSQIAGGVNPGGVPAKPVPKPKERKRRRCKDPNCHCKDSNSHCKDPDCHCKDSDCDDQDDC